MARSSSMHDRALDQQTVRAFWRVTREQPKELALISLIPLSSMVLYTVLPFITGKILSSLVQPTHHITPWIIGFCVAGLGGVVINRLGFSALFRLQPQAMAKLQADCLSLLLRRGTAFHNNQVSGKIVSDANDYVQAFLQLQNTVIIDIVPFGLTIVSGVLIISLNSWPLGLLMLIMSLITVLSGVWERRQMAPFRVKRIAATRAVTSHLADTIVNIHAVKTFAREADELAAHATLAKTLRRRREHDWHLVAVNGSRRIASLLVFQLLFILITIWLVNREPALLATGIFAFSYTITLANRLFTIGSMVRGIEEALLNAEPITAMRQEAVEIADAPNAGRLRVTAGAINLANVTFHYSDNHQAANVFEDLSLSVRPGERVGLVGPSGGGKSTITKLLLRFEDIQAGSITIDDQDITGVTQASLRENVAYVPQEPVLLHRSIAENIAYGRPDASQEQIIVAARQAYAHDFIAALPDGYDTVVGERGVKLSGGQRQRIAIARAMLKNAPILLLDEATSALDSDSEQHIQDALWHLMKGKTALVIAHRLSTIQRLDRILVMDHGQIIEQGSHATLIKQNGLYAGLWQRQSGGFIEE